MLSFFRRPPQARSAETARDRLQILLAHERKGRFAPDFLPLLQREIIEVIERHMQVDSNSVDIKIERGDDLSMLEINIELPGATPLAASART